MSASLTPLKLFLYLEELHFSNLKCLELVPEEKLDFQPVRELYNLKSTLHHMYANQKFYNLTTKAGRMDISTYKKLMAERPESKSDLREFMQEVHAQTRAVFKDEKTFSKQIATIAGTRNVLELYLGELEHQLHHRGQVYLMLRLLGITPPESGYFMGLA
ncbi:MAG: DinB family protein [candidate division Zixibacteria bacterium]|nr:DinB family protein [candidate division Zixibacteria bacterium]